MRNLKKRVCCIEVLVGIFVGSLLPIGCARPGVTGGNALPYEREYDFDLSSSASTSQSATLTIANRGSQSILMPSVFVKKVGGGASLNRDSILYPLRGMTDEEFAKATWQFVTDNTDDYCYTGSPGDPGEFSLDPMRLLNGYGLACCDQNSRILMWLWQGAGYQTRIVQMSFHVVPEIYYGGQWHMYDGDIGIYYLAEDNKSVASVAQLIADPNLVVRAGDANGNLPNGWSAQTLAQDFATATPDYYGIDLNDAEDYSLQPGQSFSLQYGLNAPTFYGPAALLPGVYYVSSGRFDWHLNYSEDYWNTLPVSLDGVTNNAMDSNVFLANAGLKPGFAVYAFSSPFPVLNLQVNGKVYRADSNATVNAYFSLDSVHWSQAFPLHGEPGIPTRTAANLTSIALGQYIYYVKLELSGDNADTAEIADVHIVSEVQDSIYAFPNLEPGTINRLTYQDWSPASTDRNVEVSLTIE